MPGTPMNIKNKNYLTIVDGTFVKKADANMPGARYREYELPNGIKGGKWEFPFTNWTGIVQSIEFQQSDYGESCLVDLGDVIMSLNTASRYFSDVACKLFNADLKKEILFHPYNMEVEGKKKTGVSVQQNSVKLKNYFWDAENRTSLHGFPVPDETKKNRKTYWKIFFTEVSEFLIEKLQTLKLNEPVKVEPTKFEDLPDIENDVPDNLPFN